MRSAPIAYTSDVNEAIDVLDSEPVFVDPSGRRRRIARNAGIVVGCLLAAYLATVAFGVVTGSRVPLTPWPASRPSARAARPGHDDVLRRAPVHTATTPRTRSRTTAPASGASPTARATAPAGSARASASPTPTHPGRGRAYGLAKAPHPKKG